MAKPQKITTTQIMRNPYFPVVVYNHNNPEIVIIGYRTWEEDLHHKTKRVSIEELKETMGQSKELVDSTQMIREWRDNEGL